MYLEFIRTACARNGAVLDIVNDNPVTGRIVFSNGRSSVFCESDLGMNSGASAELAQNKHICGIMLRHLGYQSPETFQIRLSADVAENDTKIADIPYDDIYEFTERVGYPFFLKPNMGTEGTDIFKIEDKEQIEHALHKMHIVPTVILQKACRGQIEYRVVVLNGDIKLAYGRKPFEIVGDGVNTIEHLLRETVQRYQEQGRAITLRLDDNKIDFKLAVEGLGRFAVLPEGVVINPVANVNLSEGASSFECTDLIKENFSDLCRDIHRDLGMSYFGLDLMVDWESAKPDYDIIEVNRKPGFANFASESAENRAKVQAIFDGMVATLAQRLTCPTYASTPKSAFDFT